MPRRERCPECQQLVERRSAETLVRCAECASRVARERGTPTRMSWRTADTPHAATVYARGFRGQPGG
jgi:DNA-directed RNA polymerase subunit RPC12/RpoP